MVALRKNSLNFGLFLGVFLVVMTTLIYAIDISLFTSSWIGIVNVIIITGFGAFAAMKYKKSIGGFITYKETFSSYFITVALGFFISTAFSILLFNLIDPEAKTIITENIIKYSVTMMEKFGTKAADINKMIEEMQKSDPFGTMGQVKGFAFNLIVYSIIGLIISLIIKRDRPQSI
ncbi:DUF4199 domain-containing protein [Flavobacterium psychrotolerans]|uniref:DUF4199 domain-containing protein n=1 Tax=Flavobacterium psychrotolerans TaxID=2169410 RepID=A0A2U1JKJ0_9FLAO|nr:DUF4199 domain-containing protein [Flavobacterium psychrotolerans]PWA05403.1 DUF4199 domain-containing protein [Flavobacterium psychrotolerans]